MRNTWELEATLDMNASLIGERPTISTQPSWRHWEQKTVEPVSSLASTSSRSSPTSSGVTSWSRKSSTMSSKAFWYRLSAVLVPRVS